MEILDYVKISLRISIQDEAIDALLTDLIQAAKLDLTKTANISDENFDDSELAPLLNRAIAMFVGYNWTFDERTLNNYKTIYDDLKAKLATSSAYNDSEE
ncbi:MAG: hypothetical protein KBT03_10465 [Bacteroidales bacterium]|nr:hypothetical protein [Candidatus Scybalousia scybalohippi]